jgi:hypothetical protein
MAGLVDHRNFGITASERPKTMCENKSCVAKVRFIRHEQAEKTYSWTCSIATMSSVRLKSLKFMSDVQNGSGV